MTRRACTGGARLALFAGMTQAADVMTENPVTIRATSSVGEAARLLDRLAIRHLPVIDAEGEVVGMISDRDLRGAPAAADEELAPSVPPASARVADVMSTDVIAAAPDDDLIAIAQMMVDGRVGAVPIVDNDGGLCGIVSYVDILRSLAGVSDEEAAEPARIVIPKRKRAARTPRRASRGAATPRR